MRVVELFADMLAGWLAGEVDTSHVHGLHNLQERPGVAHLCS